MSLETIWEVVDKAAVDVSGKFYEILSLQIRDQRHLCDVAFALHEVVQVPGRKRPKDPLSWAPLIYFLARLMPINYTLAQQVWKGV